MELLVTKFSVSHFIGFTIFWDIFLLQDIKPLASDLRSINIYFSVIG